MNDIVAQILKNPCVRYMRSASDPTYQHVFYAPFASSGVRCWPTDLRFFGNEWSIPLKKPSDIRCIITSIDNAAYWNNTLARQRTVRAWYATVPAMGDLVPDPPFEPHWRDMTGTLTDEVKLGIKCAIARNARVRRAMIELNGDAISFGDTPEYRWFMDDNCEIVASLHVVTSLRELIRRTINKTVRTVLPYYTPNIRTYGNPVVDDLDEWQKESVQQCSVMASLAIALLKRVNRSEDEIRARWPALFEMPLVPVTSEWFAVTTTLDLDGIADALDNEGWTPAMTLFAIEQLRIDNMHQHKFFEFLAFRTDLPDAVSTAMRE